MSSCPECGSPVDLHQGGGICSNFNCQAIVRLPGGSELQVTGQADEVAEVAARLMRQWSIFVVTNDLGELAEDLHQLRSTHVGEMDEATREAFADAEDAAKKRDTGRLRSALMKGGALGLSIATSAGSSLVADAIRHAFGI